VRKGTQEYTPFPFFSLFKSATTGGEYDEFVQYCKIPIRQYNKTYDSTLKKPSVNP